MTLLDSEEKVASCLAEAESCVRLGLVERAEELLEAMLNAEVTSPWICDRLRELHQKLGGRGDLAQILVSAAESCHEDQGRATILLQKALCLTVRPEAVLDRADRLGITLELTMGLEEVTEPESMELDVVELQEPWGRQKTDVQLQRVLEIIAVDGQGGGDVQGVMWEVKDRVSFIERFLCRVEGTKELTRFAVSVNAGLPALVVYASSGGLCFGLSVDGELYRDGQFEQAVPRAADRIKAMLMQEALKSASGENIHTLAIAQRLEELALRRDVREALLDVSVRGLLKCVRAWEGQRVCVTTSTPEVVLETELVFGVCEIFEACGRELDRKSDDVACQVFEEFRDHVEGGWLLLQAGEVGSYLPSRAFPESSLLTIQEIGALGRSTGGLRELLGQIRREPSSEGATVATLISQDGAWCYVSSEKHVALLRVPQTHLGRVMGRAQRLVEERL